VTSLADIYWLFLQPSTAVFILLLLSFLLLWSPLLKAGRALLTFTLVLAIIPSLFPLGPLLALPLESFVPPRVALPERVDGIIVLGGAVEWRVTEARGQLALGQSGERMVAGAALARRYPDAALILTGIFGETLSGEFSPNVSPRRFFTGPEFANRRVIYVGAARSTYEDGLLSLEAVQPRAGETYLLVTSALHMPRALGVFQTLGWNVVPYPVDYRTTGRERLEFIPSTDVLGRLVELDYVVREWGALLIYNRSGRTSTLFPNLN
jgi:uncharacterized SAM-binding protein YcdF (DUF218 family)